jgi:hypothetical protein
MIDAIEHNDSFDDIRERKQHIDDIKDMANNLLARAHEFSSVIVITVKRTHEGSDMRRSYSGPYFECIGALRSSEQVMLSEAE